MVVVGYEVYSCANRYDVAIGLLGVYLMRHNYGHGSELGYSPVRGPFLLRHQIHVFRTT